MQASVGSKWKAVAFRHRTGCSTCKSSRQVAFTEREWLPPRNSVECEILHSCVSSPSCSGTLMRKDRVVPLAVEVGSLKPNGRHLASAHLDANRIWPGIEGR